MDVVDLSVLVPVYNNAATLDNLISRLRAVLEPLAPAFEIVFVDDGSRDASLAILRRHAANDPRIRVFALARNFGSQAASCAACDQARGRRIVHIDADLEVFPEDIPRLLEQLDRGCDLVCGYRESAGDRSHLRRLCSALINMYVRRRTETPIRDVGCSMRALDARLIHNLAAEGEARRLMTPILLRRARRLVQVPVRHQPRATRGGHSFLTLLGIALDYYLFTARRPFLISGLFCAVTLVSGIVLSALGTHLFGLILAATAVLGAILSLIGEYAQRMYHLAQRLPFYELRDLSHEPPADPERGEPPHRVS
jgi:glycosyltransferase involved in cell wall biosynthesis